MGIIPRPLLVYVEARLDDRMGEKIRKESEAETIMEARRKLIFFNCLYRWEIRKLSLFGQFSSTHATERTFRDGIYDWKAQRVSCETSDKARCWPAKLVGWNREYLPRWLGKSYLAFLTLSWKFMGISASLCVFPRMIMIWTCLPKDNECCHMNWFQKNLQNPIILF